MRTEKDEVWLDSFTEIGVDLAYAAEGYVNPSDNHQSDVQATATTATFKPSKSDEYQDPNPFHLIPPSNNSSPTKLTNNAKQLKETKSSTQFSSQPQYKT